ncbi:MAG: hypothetical protein IJY31_07085 [Muribaculaceae bacterium]|nr:hypothetical protein [Muribaculaceae bacterium]
MKSCYWVLLFAMTVSFISCEEDKYIQEQEQNAFQDNYTGATLSFQIEQQTDGFSESNAVCVITAPDGSVIRRECTHQRIDNLSNIEMPVGLKDGTYRLLYFEYALPSPQGDNGKFKTAQFGLGFNIKVNSGNATILDTYDTDTKLSGDGSEDNPYHISSYTHLLGLMTLVNDGSIKGKYFIQDADINLSYASYLCSHTNGWLPIGNDTNTPFIGYYNGNGKTISGISCNRPNSIGIGLFGFIKDSEIKGLTITDSELCGNFAVGSLAGMIISDGGERDVSVLDSCTVSGCTVSGSNNSVSVGGILGGIDMYARGNIYDCLTANGTTVSADYNAGGIIGASGLYTSTVINRCSNSGSVTSKYAGAGGIIATADTICVTTCHNSGTVTAAVSQGENMRGAGGICGGTGISYITGCENSGTVSGHEGVGGILGSTRLGQNEKGEYVFNSSYLRYCKNSGVISGNNNVGGLCGEAQLGCYGTINTGAVSGGDYIGGIGGYTSLAVIHNTVNTANVSGGSYVSGIVGKSNMGSFAMCQNLNSIKGSGSYIGGIVGLTSDNTIIHYCGNFSTIEGGPEAIGGIVGKIGEAHEMSGLNIAECVFGSVEIVLSFMGPFFAVIESATSVSHTVCHALEISIEAIAKSISIAFMGHAGHELAHPHELELELTEIKADLSKKVKSITDEINSARKTATLTLSTPFSTSPITSYQNAMISLSDHLMADAGNGTETNNETFNKKINEARQERASEVEELNHSKELAYVITGAICLVATTAATIATIATGGAAAPMLAGVAFGIVGGVNSIVKGATDYPENIVILSQCVNTGNISGTGSSQSVGGIAGHLCDRGCIRDCLNTGDGPGNRGGQLVGNMDHEYSATNCLGISDVSKWDGLFGDTDINTLSTYSGLYYYATSTTGEIESAKRTAPEISNPASYNGWDIGSSNRWTIPSVTSGNSFPIPLKSEMQ